MFGRAQEIEVGPMSGLSNVAYWLRHRNIEPSSELTQAILAVAKDADHVLSSDEIEAIIHQSFPADGRT